MRLTYFRGRVGLYALLKSLGIGKGDQVAIQAFTCLAVPEAVFASGALPVYVDTVPGGFNMDVDDLKLKLTEQTRAIVVQHTYGIPSDMDSIVRIAEAHGTPIIEDCCHTLASRYKGRSVGTFGVGSFYSFEWGKPVVAGVGGCIRVNDSSLLNKIRDSYTAYRYPGLFSQARIELQYYAFSLIYRPSLYWPLRAIFHALGALGLAESNYNAVGSGKIAHDFGYRMTPGVKRRMLRKLSYQDRLTRHSLWVTRQYRRSINSALVTHPVLSDSSQVVFARYPLLATNKTDLLAAANRAHVELSDWYNRPVHPISREDWVSVCYEAGSCPEAERVCLQAVTLPTHPAVKKHDVDRAICFLNEGKVGE